MSFTPSPEQQAFYDRIKNTNNNIILEARAGTGKTSAIIGSLDGIKGRTFIGAFNKSIALELKARIGRRPNIFAATFHSAGFGYLRNHYDGIEVDGDKTRGIGKNITKTKAEKKYLSVATRLVSIAKNNGIGLSSERPIGQKTFKFLSREYGIDWKMPREDEIRTEVFDLASQILIESNKSVAKIDFDDMIYLALLNECQGYTYDNVMIDEAQDINSTKLALASRMVKPTGRLIAVGDRNQAIYGFTGAMSNSLDKIKEAFDADELPLTVTWRCPVSVTKEAQKLVPDIRHRDNAPEGKVRDVNFSDLVKELKNANPQETAIVCRFNKPLVTTALRLIQSDISCYVEGREIGAFLLKKWKVSTIKPFLGRVATFRRNEMAKAMEEGNASIAAWVEDECGVVEVCALAALDQGMETMDELRDFMGKLFSKKNGICLSSIHKSKGLEWDNVYILFRNELMPARFAFTDDQRQAERNLEYVAITRSKNEIINIIDDADIL